MKTSKPKKLQKKPIFICCEGKTEIAFLKYIKGLYLKGKAGKEKSVQIQSEDGGSLSIMQNTIRKRKRDFDVYKAYVLLDEDQVISEAHKNPSPEVLFAKPCIEGLFLDILGHQKKQTSIECKKDFEKHYLDQKKKLKPSSYENLFSKDILEKKRKDIPLLNRILSIFE